MDSGEAHRQDESAAPDARTWCEAHYGSLLAHALRRVRSHPLACDLVQETLLAAWRSRHACSGRAGARAWLHGILRNKIADHFRRELSPYGRRAPGAPTRSSAEAGAWLDDTDRGLDRLAAPRTSEPLTQMLASESLSELWDRIGRLPALMSRALLLSVVEELDPERVCAELRISRGHLAVLLHRARARLRESP